MPFEIFKTAMRVPISARFPEWVRQIRLEPLKVSQAWSQIDLFPDGEMSLRKLLWCLVGGAMSGIIGVLVFNYFVSREGIKNPGPEQIEGNNDRQKIAEENDERQNRRPQEHEENLP